MIPYTRVRNKSRGNGVSWDDGHISYSELHAVLKETVAGYVRLYAYGTDKSDYLSDMINRTFPNLEDFNRQQSRDLKSDISCGFPCHKFPTTRCATRTAHCLYEWLMYHFQTKANVNRPKDFTRHTSTFISALWKACGRIT